MSAKSDGCYKADAPPSFVGQQMMSVGHGRSVVNPLYIIYACFDTTATTVKCTEDSSCWPATSTSGTVAATSKPTPPTTARKAERKALPEAEEAAGPAVVQEVSEAEKREQRATEKPLGAAEPEVGK